MNSSTQASTRTSDPGRPVLLVPALKWWKLVRELRRRGGGRRESGAFLLGRRDGRRAKVTRCVCYDDLDPHALDTGIVRFDSSGFSKLWALCRESKLEVLADVHTHPDGRPRQSESDRTNPMISERGHIALILPLFARTLGWRFKNVAIYEYEGNYRWRDVQHAGRKGRVRFTWW